VGGLQGDLKDEANAEAELQIRLHRTDGRLLRAIEEALGRIRQGTYGICGVCNQPISRARLKAVPWTHHCRDCKSRDVARQIASLPEDGRCVLRLPRRIRRG